MCEISAKNGKKSRKGGGQVTKKQRKEVRRALRQYDGHGRWAAVLARVKEYYARTDPACWELLRMRYLDGMREEDVIRALYIGRTTYYSKELEALSTVGIYAAAAGLLDAE